MHTTENKELFGPMLSVIIYWRLHEINTEYFNPYPYKSLHSNLRSNQHVTSF